MYYNVDGVPCSLDEWEAEHAARENIIGRDRVCGILVSTVSLGIDHGFGVGSTEIAPVLWETMCFVEEGDTLNKWDEYCERYTSRKMSERRHREIVEKIKREKSEK